MGGAPTVSRGRLLALLQMPHGREFAASDLAAALAYIEALPEDIRRVYMDVRDERGAWRCVYADDRGHVSRLLKGMILGRDFRLRGVDIPTPI